MAGTPGLLYVTMQRHESLPEAQFHDWYNNEHGPIRLRLPFVSNGFRYRATDAADFLKDKPEWMALYDFTDMSNIKSDAYTRLRDPKGVQSQRERDTMSQITVNRKVYDFLSSKQSPNFKKLEDVESEGTVNVMTAVISRLNPGADKEAFQKSDEEHVEALSKEKGWLRSRRFVTSTCEGQKPESEIEYLSIHEFAPGTAIPSKTQTSPEIGEQKIRQYELYYTFGPAPRDLTSLYSPTAIQTFSSLDTKTQTFTTSSNPLKVPIIKSYITTPDNTILPYYLSGSSDPKAPLIVFCNSILVSHSIWGGFISKFFSNPKNLSKYRVLLYEMRGRFSPSGTKNVTVDVLAQDVITILDALRVPKAKCVIGVSLGGATALTLAVRSPFSSRLESFIACDTSMKSPAGNSTAWGERIDVAEKESLSLPSASPFTTSASHKVVGENLADLTVRRWFVPENHTDPSFEKVKEMVKTNDLEGFKESVRALFEYDLCDEVKRFRGKGLFVVGSGDGALPKSMKGMADSLGSEVGGKGELVVIEGAGHLPMVEKPEKFAEVVEGFLG